jgi:thiamine-phosphate pyrophosphorylase
VRAVKAAVRIPVVGIGGIKAENAAPVIQAGADGVAVITGIVGAPEIAAAAARLLEAVRSARRPESRA